MESIAKGVKTTNSLLGALIGYRECEITAGTFAYQYPIQEIKNEEDAVVIVAEEHGSGFRVKDVFQKIAGINKQIYINDGNKRHNLDAIFVENGGIVLATGDEWEPYAHKRREIQRIMSEMDFIEGDVHNKNTSDEAQEYVHRLHGKNTVIIMIRSVDSAFRFKYSHEKSKTELRTRWMKPGKNHKETFLALFSEFCGEAIHFANYFSQSET